MTQKDRLAFQTQREDQRRQALRERAKAAEQERDQERENTARLYAINACMGIAFRERLDDDVAERLIDRVERRRREAFVSDQKFDAFRAATEVLHEIRTARGEPSIAPAPTGPNAPTVQTQPVGQAAFDARTASRDAYNAQLARLGLSDPAVYSSPSGGGFSRH